MAGRAGLFWHENVRVFISSIFLSKLSPRVSEHFGHDTVIPASPNSAELPHRQQQTSRWSRLNNNLHSKTRTP